MKVFSCRKNIAGFMQSLACQRDKYLEWQFFDCLVLDKNIIIDEIWQFVNHNFRSDQAYVMAKDDGLLICTHKKDLIGIKQLQKETREVFSEQEIKIETSVLNPKGLVQLSNILEPYISQDNLIARITHTRMKRSDNIFMVLDDDEIVLKRMDGILSNFGRVILVEKPDKFADLYMQYAPDIVFLDIDLDSQDGDKMLNMIRQKIDPYAHVTLLSDHVKRKTVQDALKDGAKGFLIKPVDKNHVYKYVIKAETVALNRIWML